MARGGGDFAGHDRSLSHAAAGGVGLLLCQMAKRLSARVRSARYRPRPRLSWRARRGPTKWSCIRPKAHAPLRWAPKRAAGESKSSTTRSVKRPGSRVSRALHHAACWYFSVSHPGRCRHRSAAFGASGLPVSHPPQPLSLCGHASRAAEPRWRSPRHGGSRAAPRSGGAHLTPRPCCGRPAPAGIPRNGGKLLLSPAIL